MISQWEVYTVAPPTSGDALTAWAAVEHVRAQIAAAGARVDEEPTSAELLWSWRVAHGASEQLPSALCERELLSGTYLLYAYRDLSAGWHEGWRDERIHVAIARSQLARIHTDPRRGNELAAAMIEAFDMLHAGPLGLLAVAATWSHSAVHFHSATLAQRVARALRAPRL